MNKRFELIGHADLAINNIHIFNGYGEEVPEGRTPIYAGYPQPKPDPLTDEQVEKIIKSNMSLQMNLAGIRQDFEEAHGIN